MSKNNGWQWIIVKTIWKLTKMRTHLHRSPPTTVLRFSSGCSCLTSQLFERRCWIKSSRDREKHASFNEYQSRKVFQPPPPHPPSHLFFLAQIIIFARLFTRLSFEFYHYYQEFSSPSFFDDAWLIIESYYSKI